MYRRRLVIILISLLVSFFIVEIILAKYFPQKIYFQLFKNSIACFSKSETTVFTLKKNCTIPFTDFDTNESFSTKTNSLGYRGEEFTLLKPFQEKRVLISGDSFILGFGVKDERVVSTQLEAQLSKINKSNSLFGAKVINAGYKGGFGPDGYYLQLKNEGVKLSPDLVVFSIFVYNDLSDIEDNEWIGIGEYGQPEKIISKTTTIDGAGHLIHISIPPVYRLPIIRNSQTAILIHKALTRMNERLKHYYDRIRFKIKPPIMPTGEARDSNLPGTYHSFCIFGGTCHRKTLHLFSDLMSTIKASNTLIESLFKDNNPHFVVLIIPAEFQLYPETLKKYNDPGIPHTVSTDADPNPQKRLREMLGKENIPYIDLLPTFKKIQERLYFVTDGHWNKKGHQVVAEEIAKWIKMNYR